MQCLKNSSKHFDQIPVCYIPNRAIVGTNPILDFAVFKRSPQNHPQEPAFGLCCKISSVQQLQPLPNGMKPRFYQGIASNFGTAQSKWGLGLF
jgi:hypothetical protein